MHVPGHDPLILSFRSFSFLIGWEFYGPEHVYNTLGYSKNSKYARVSNSRCAVFSYAIRSRKLSANEQIFC